VFLANRITADACVVMELGIDVYLCGNRWMPL